MSQVGLNFILNALAGVNCDEYYRDNKEEINQFLDLINKEFKHLIPENQIIYRGILLDPTDPEKSKILEPIDHIEYISFSTELSSAEVFADISHPMAMFYRMKKAHHKGYIIKSNINEEKLIFHWHWIDALYINKYFDKESIKTLIDQKEVMVLQQGKKYELNEKGKII